MLELEPKFSDVWSWSQGRSLKFGFGLHSPGSNRFVFSFSLLRYCSCLKLRVN